MLTYLIVIQIGKTGMLVDQTRADETEIHKTYLGIFGTLKILLISL